MMKSSKSVYIVVAWNNPYTKPPAGQDVALIWGRAPREKMQELSNIIKKNDPTDLGSGYSQHWWFDPFRRTNFKIGAVLAERRKKMKLKKFKQQLKLPGLAEQGFRDMLRERPEYFDPDEIEKRQQEKRDYEDRHIRHLQENMFPPEKMVVDLT